MDTPITHHSALPNAVSLFLGSVVLIGLSLVSPQTRALAADTAAIHVQLNDLDLSSQEGQAKAYQRVSKAARTVCWRVSDSQDIGLGFHVARCIDAVVKQANASVAQLAQKQQSQLAQNASR